jgi:hypothetical protein
MSTSRKHPEETPLSSWRPGNREEALKLLDHWLKTDKTNEDDRSDWEELKKLLDEDRLSGRKLFPK